MLLEEFMVKNNRLSFRISSERKELFKEKCKTLGLSEIEFIEKICDEPIIFLDNKFKLNIEWVATV